MRKTGLLAILLTLALILSSVQAVFAADKFEEWGDMDEWTDEQFEESESWSEEEWDAYWEAADAHWEKQHKKELGLTNTEGINVILNGECLDFGDATPVAKQGMTMVPLRTLFEAMGGESAFAQTPEGQKITVENRVGTKLTFMVGEAVYYMDKKDGERKAFQMSAAPYVEEGVAYVPLRDLAEDLGYDVLWNDWNQVAELIQRDKLISYIDDKFTLYNRLLTEADYDPEKTYKTTSDFDLALTLYGDQRHDSGTLSGRITAITKGAGANMKGDLQLDLTDFNDSLLTGAEKETLDMLKKMRNISAEAIFDGEGGSLYLKSSLLPLWMESAAGLKFSESDWLFVSFFEGLSQEELDSVREFLTLMKDPGEMTMGEILYRSWVGEGGSTWTVNLYEQLMSSISMMEIFLGDSNFKHRGNSYVLEMGRFELMMQIAAASGAKITDVDVTEALEILEMIPSANYKLTLTEKNGKLTDIAMSGQVKIQTQVPINISFSLTGDSASSKGDFALTGRYVGKITGTMSSSRTETTETLKMAPADGATVQDLSELLEYDPEFEEDGPLAYGVSQITALGRTLLDQRN